MKTVNSKSGLTSIFILLILSLLSLFSFSLFRTSLNNHYIVRNEVVAQQSFYRAQSVAVQMANVLRHLNSNDFSSINHLTNLFSWLTDEHSIDLKKIGNPSYWHQLSTRHFPPDAQGIAVLLKTTDSQMPSESLIMTNARHIQTHYFSILAMAEILGSTAIVEMGFCKRIIQ